MSKVSKTDTGEQGLSLSEIQTSLMNEEAVFGKVDETPPDLTVEAQKAADLAAAEAEKKKGKEEEEGEEEEATEDTGEESAEEEEESEDDKSKKSKKDEAAEEEEEEESEDEEDEAKAAEAFYTEVEKYLGDTGVKFEKGLDPETTAKNIQKVADSAIQGFDEYLKSTFPTAYAHFLHLQNGGTDDDFMKEVPSTPPTEEALTASEALQEATVKAAYKEMGHSDSEINALVAALKTDGKLLEKSKAISATNAKKINDLIANKEKEQSDAIAKVANAKKAFEKKVDKVITKGEVAGFVIPEKDRNAFAEFFTSRIIPTGDGKFLMQYELNQDELEYEMQKEFLRYKKGNLKDIVVRQAKSMNAQSLRLRVKDEQVGGTQKKKSTSTDNLPIPLGNLFGGPIN